MNNKKWDIIIETLEKWSHEIVYYWETTIPSNCKYGKAGKVLKSKEYRSKRMALISWKKFAEENKLSKYSIYDGHKAVQISS